MLIFQVLESNCSIVLYISVFHWDVFLLFWMSVMMHSVDEVTEMGCCGCLGFSFARKPKKVGRPNRGYGNSWSHEPLLQQEVEEVEDDGFDSGDIIDTGTEDDEVCHSPVKRSEEILMERAQNGLICREIPVKETHKVVRTEVVAGKLFLTFVVKILYSYK